WNVPSDNVGVTGYRLYWKASTASTYSGPVTITSPAYTLNTLSSAVTYNMYVVAFDAAGNSSVPSSVLNATTLDNVPPTAPGGLTVTGSTSSSLSLSWTASTDNLSVSGYRVYWKASADASYTNTPITTTSRTITLSSLLANTSYDIKVEAYDAASNVSSATTVTASTPAATVTPTLSSTLQGTASGNSHTLNWAVASSGATVSAIQLQVKKDNGAFTLLTSYSAPFNASGSFTNSSLPRGKYTYRVFVTGQSSGTGSAMSAYSNTIVFNVR
ncbi:MAG: fibronectin type III domain-containing protein, partial [Chitinophagaceae bacterium]